MGSTFPSIVGGKQVFSNPGLGLKEQILWVSKLAIRPLLCKRRHNKLYLLRSGLESNTSRGEEHIASLGDPVLHTGPYSMIAAWSQDPCAPHFHVGGQGAILRTVLDAQNASKCNSRRCRNQDRPKSKARFKGMKIAISQRILPFLFPKLVSILSHQSSIGFL